MTKILINEAVVRQALEALEYISSHYMSLPKIGCMALAALRQALEQPAPDQIDDADTEHQKYIDGLPHCDDKMYAQIDQWTRESYRRHKYSVSGQAISAGDAESTHRIWAAFRWAKEYGNPLQPAPTQEPVGFDEWWHNEGSEAPKPTDDMYEHCKRMCEIAWRNGVYKALEQPAPPECKTEAEKTAFAFGWFKALESVREQPAPAQPLTDEQIQKLRHNIDWTASWSYINFARAIEAAHGITSGKATEKGGAA